MWRQLSPTIPVTACLLFTLGTSHSWGAPKNSDADPQLPFERYRLSNGMEVILHQDNSVPLVCVNVWYHVGSGDEVPGKSGFAHLFEHLMFQGTQHTGEDAHFPILQRVGGSNINGTTNSDRTNYYEVVPAHQLEVALWLESDRMGYFLPLLNEQSLANQKAVVRNERRQSYENQPYGKEWFALMEALYTEGHPYRYDTIGRHEDLENATLADARAFYKAWYVPANATVTIAGDIDIDQTKGLIEKWFGSFPASQQPQRRKVPPTPIHEEKRLQVDDPLAQLQRLHYAWHSPAFFAAGDAEMDILAATLGRQGSGRLYRRLVHEDQLAQQVAVYQSSAEFSSIFHLMVDLKPGVELSKVEGIVAEELGQIRTAPITDHELKRAITDVETHAIWALEALHYRSDLLQRYNHYVGNPDYLSQDLDRYRTASVSSVQEYAQEILDESKRVVVITKPAGHQP